MLRTPPRLALAADSWGPLGILLLVAIALALSILVLTHLIGPRRRGAIKDSPYESGMEPVGDSRRRFNVRFYLVAMLFLLFDVEIVFFYPWATLFPRLTLPGPEHAAWSEQVRAAGFGAGFFLWEMLIFIAILLVGYIYAWRKGVFRWD